MTQDYGAFWAFVLEKLSNTDAGLFSGVHARTGSWVTATAGVPGVYYAIAASRRDGWAKVEILMQRESSAENLWMFSRLREWRRPIEAKFGNELEWVSSSHTATKRYRIAYTAPFDVSDQRNWQDAADWFAAFLPKLEASFARLISGFGNLIPPDLEDK